jgi:hypothetical protein
MNNALSIREQLPMPTAEDIEKALLVGNLATLTAEQRQSYYMAICQSAGLNPLTRPFTLMKNKGGDLFFYANKECAEQLRSRDAVSLQILSRETESDVGIYTVTIRASLPNGRKEDAQGVVDITNLKGQALADARMRAESKAKRRATLAICGLGFAGEEDREGYATVVSFDPQTGEIREPRDMGPVPVGAPTIRLPAGVQPLPRPASPPTGILLTDINQLLVDQGLSEEGIRDYWVKQEKKYPDFTPGVMAMIWERLKKAAEEKAYEQKKAVVAVVNEEGA